MKTKAISQNSKHGKGRSDLPGFLVKHVDDNSFGILISQDDNHSEFWKVFSSNGIVTWYKPKCEILT